MIEEKKKNEMCHDCRGLGFICILKECYKIILSDECVIYTKTGQYRIDENHKQTTSREDFMGLERSPM